MIVKKLRALEFLMCGILIVFLIVGCAKQKLDPAGIYLAIGGQAYVEIGKDASNNFIIKGTSLFSGLPGLPDYEPEWVVSFKRQKLMLVFKHRTVRTKWESRTYYEFLPSSTTPGDWDLVRQYHWSGASKDIPAEDEISPLENPIPSYLHRVDDRRVVEYFNLVADYAEVYGPGPDFGPKPDVDRLLELASGLLESHPDDLHVRTLYLDALVIQGNHETLESRLTDWKEAYATTDDRLLSKVFRQADNSLHALQLSAAGRNAHDFILKVLGPDTDLATRLELFPDIFDYEEYARPQSSLVLTRIANFLELQIAIKVFRVEAVFLMLQGKREEALKLLAASYHFGQLLNQSNTFIGRLIGGALRLIACKGLEIYALNCCETSDEFQHLWETLEELEPKREVRDIAELLPFPSGEAIKAIKDSEIRLRRTDASFQLLRMATAAKYRFVTQQAFPRSPDEFAPLLPDGPPQDPFTTGPLRFFSDPNLFTCYSIGSDEQDNGATVSYDPTNGIASRGDIIVEIPHEREYPFPRDGVSAASADELRRQFPNGLPVDPFADTRGKPLGITNTTPVYVYSYGPDTDEWEATQAGDRYVPEVHYDPTNGTISPGDLFIAIPR